MAGSHLLQVKLVQGRLHYRLWKIERMLMQEGSNIIDPSNPDLDVRFLEGTSPLARKEKACE